MGKKKRSQELAVIEEAEMVIANSDIPLMNPAVFKQMWRIGTAMATASLIPDSLKGENFEQTQANCLQLVNFAVNAQMDPFAVCQSSSVINGKICHEGKLVNAMIQAKLGIDLDYEWNDKTGDAYGIVVSGMINGKMKSINGTVAGWKTTRTGSPWIPKQHKMMLAYRGAREWCRLYRPGIMLGVYATDEMEPVAETVTRSIGAPAAPTPKPKPKEEVVEDSETIEEDIAPGEILAKAELWFGNCSDLDQVEMAWSELEHYQEQLSDEDAHSLRQMYEYAVDLFTAAEVRVECVTGDEQKKEKSAPSAPSAPAAPKQEAEEALDRIDAIGQDDNKPGTKAFDYEKYRTSAEEKMGAASSYGDLDQIYNDVKSEIFHRIPGAAQKAFEHTYNGNRMRIAKAESRARVAAQKAE
ncbi:MAG: hypothetical protein GY938_24430 [Ketobacter sp.]|nr:hypothetical protein [Ketobacter sp.]